MNRRELLGVLGGTVALPLSDHVMALGRALHAQAARRDALQVLDPHQAETVATIAELIIPATETPGARAARVHEFIDLLLAEWVSDEERTQFLQGLADVDARAQAAYGGDFLSATAQQRVTILTQLDGEAQAHGSGKPDAPPSFFQHMKFVTVYGYCTSQVGATSELHYEAVPGSYDACTELGRWRAAPGDF